MYTKKEIVDIANLGVIRGFAVADDNFEDGVNSILTLSTGWTVGSDGIAISTNGGWGNSAIYNKYTTIDRTSTRALVEIIDTGSIFGIIRKHSSFGTVAQVDCTAMQLKFYGSWDGSASATSVVKSIAIPFTIVANRKYLCELKKDRAKHIFTFTDTVVPTNTISLTYDNEVDSSSGAGRQFGTPGVMFNSGSIKLKRFTYATPFPYNPRVLITGHSFVEGYALINVGNVNGTYSNLLHTALGGNVAIAGRGGETSASLLTRNDINFFFPRYHIVDIGSNDSDYATWLSNIQTYITSIIATNAIPVLCTIVPRSGIQTFINSANSWIRSSGYNYIDFAKAVTVNNDSVTQDSTLFDADTVHPNVAGNLRIFKQIMVDAPYLFDGVAASVSNIVTEFSITEVSKTASFSVSAADKYKKYVINSTSPVTITVPSGLTEGLWWEFLNINSGVVTFAAGSGATIISPDSRLKMRTQFSQARLEARASSQTALMGDIIL